MVEEQVLTQTQEIAQQDLQVEVVTEPVRFNSIATEWDRLVERSGQERLFLCHTWLRTWWEAFAADSELYVVLLRSKGELVGAAPMMRSRARMFGLKISSIQSMYNPHTPRCDFIVADGFRDCVYGALWNFLRRRTEFDLIALKQIPDSSPTVSTIERYALADGWLSGQWTAPSSPYIPLNCTYEDLLKTLKGGYRYNLRKRYERLSKTGPIDVEVITDRERVGEAMQDGLRIEAAAWKGQRGTAILSDAAATEFYVRLAERLAELGQLRLSFLRVDGKRISFSYILRSDNKLYGVKIGYDPEYHTYSPGNMLLNLILQDACANQLAEYDFLGVNDEWKLDWTQSARGHRWLFLFRNSIKPRFLRYLKFSFTPRIKPRLVRLCTSLRGQA